MKQIQKQSLSRLIQHQEITPYAPLWQKKEDFNVLTVQVILLKPHHFIFA